jgi:epsilon-lactone hydrolase
MGMSQEQLEAVQRLLRDGPLDMGGEAPGQRAIFEQMMAARPLAADVTTRQDTLGGVPVVAVDVAETEPRGVVVYFHGGGYALGSAAATVGLASDVARSAGARVISVDYRLAPEHPYPAATDDALAAWQGLLDAGQDPAETAFVGESAGGGLALAAMLAARDAGLPLPSSAVLMSPWADLTLAGASMTGKAAADPALTAAGLRRRALDYAAGQDLAQPLISPVFGDLAGLPALLIQAGSDEILLDDATRLAARAAACDVAVTLQVTPGVPHVFQGFAAVLEEGAAALASAGSFLRDHLTVGALQ